MTNTTTLTQLRTRAKRRADMEDGGVVNADAEWNDYINEELSELHDLMIDSSEDYSLTKDTSITLASGTDLYNLPGDFYKLRGVDLVGSTTISLRPFMFNERNVYKDSITDAYHGFPYLYHLQGVQIRFLPVPGTAEAVHLWYVPQVTKLALDADAVDTVLPNGWEQYVVLGSAIRALLKEESLEQAGFLQQEKARVQAHIVRMAQSRDEGFPRKIVNTRNFVSRRYR